MWRDAEYPADPYPGAFPPGSYAHVAEVAYPVRDGAVEGVPLDAWLRGRGASPLAERIPVLTYGSNRCPSKITWLRRQLGLGAGPVVVLRATTYGVAAVWAAGLRARDGARPAVLAEAPDAVEEHAVWLATSEQIAVLDRCEGRDERFRLARLRTGSVTVCGVPIERPWVYLGYGAIRRPLLVDGAPVRCADVAQGVARTLVGDPATGDGLAADTVVGAPHPDEWPEAIFAYGLLQPGQLSWRLVGPHAVGPARPATVEGGVFDTGRGFPAWLPDVAGRTPGVVVSVRDPAALLPALDAYEGPDYDRVRVVADGTVCWAYAWRACRSGLVPLPDGWAARVVG
ncbi:MAG TPA: gamma-glutamylcyclotransferase family protein [Pseudonocardia sp.]